MTAKSADLADRLHSGWWLWAAAAGVAISLVAEPLVLAAALPIALLTAGRRAETPAALQSFRWLFRAALLLAAIRFLLQIAVGTPMGGEIVLRLPSLQLPPWLAGLRLGGEITRESIEFGLVAGLRLAALVVIVAAAAAIATPRRLLANPPPALRELAMLTSLAAGFLPQLARDAERMQRAARWRGEDAGRLQLAVRSIVPLTETALDRGVSLGASLALRGYGRAATVPVWRWLLRGGIALFGLSLALMFTDTGSPALRLFTAVASGVLLGAGWWRQRPETVPVAESWSWPAVAFGGGALAAAALAIAGQAGPALCFLLLQGGLLALWPGKRGGS